MEYQTLRVEMRDGYAVVTLDRPQVKNALNTQMRAELLHAMKDVAKTARAVVLTGAGARVLFGAGSVGCQVDRQRESGTHAARRICPALARDL